MNTNKVLAYALAAAAVLAACYAIGRKASPALVDGRTGAAIVEAGEKRAQMTPLEGSVPELPASSAPYQSSSASLPEAPSRAAVGTDSKYLPLEAGLLTGGYINQSATELLASKRFDAFLNRFEAQNFGTSDELTAQYRAKFENDFQSMDAAKSLGRLSCATDVCIATVRTAEEDPNFDAWYGSLQAKSALPIMAMTQATVQLPGGDVEHRLMFTTSKGSGGFALGMNPH
jgi:hypothetical protein